MVSLSRLFPLLLVLCIVCSSTTLQTAKATRLLDMEQWLKKQVPLLESHPRGPVPPSGGSRCTYIPGQGSGTCSLNGMNFAGHVVRAPPAFPAGGSDFAAATMTKEAKEENPSS
ncbi:unnamed protein product [Ilex paraguariensis]|uniref:Uncharacterized protein n=1 Tax=Ilex paraguariensis TaxID=185542 RepID=A0ABC8USE0_9AQUA